MINLPIWAVVPGLLSPYSMTPIAISWSMSYRSSRQRAGRRGVAGFSAASKSVAVVCTSSKCA